MTSSDLVQRQETPAAAPAPPRPARSTSTRKRRLSPLARRRRWLGLAFAAPALLFYGFVVLVPILQSVNYSLYSWDGVSAARWVGFSNYVSFFTDPELIESLGHVLVLVVFFSLIPIALGLISPRRCSDGGRQRAAAHTVGCCSSRRSSPAWSSP